MKEAMLIEFMKTNELAGLSVGVYEGKWESFYLGVAGKVEPYNHQIIREGMYYDLASLTKVIGTTTRILQLIQDKRLNLETMVSEILLEYPNLSMTIDELLRHTSGLPADYPDKRNFSKTALQEFYTKFIVPNKKQTIYSDLGFLLLGRIIEEIDGTDLAISFSKNIFEPLKMTQTGFDFKMPKTVIVPTELTSKRGLIAGVVHDSKAFSLGKPVGSAGLFSTLTDLEKFTTALIINKFPDGSAFFSDAIYHMLQHNQMDSRTWGWACPFHSGIIYHTGFTGPVMGIDLIKKRSLILLTNRIHPTREDHGYLANRYKLIQSFFVE